jgi:hypothetical protein
VVVLFKRFGAMAPIMALKPVIKAKANTEPDQTCFCVVGGKSENQSVSHIIIIAYLMRERERERRERIHGIR